MVKKRVISKYYIQESFIKPKKKKKKKKKKREKIAVYFYLFI